MSNPDALNRFIAEKVLGWSLRNHFGWVTPAGHRKDLPDFYHSFANCEPILEKIEKDGWELEMHSIKGMHSVWLTNPEGYLVSSSIQLPTLPAALVECVALAYGWKGE